MTVRFILGRAGSGKTWTCLENIRKAVREDPLGPPVFFLVPEQASFQMERELVAGPGVQAVIRAQVLSFRRLAWRVFEEAGGPAQPPLSDLGKQMALRSMLQKRGDELVFFRGATLTPGFATRLASTLSEMKIYGITPEVLEQWLAEREAGEGGARVDAPTLAKAHDLLLLYRDYQAYLAGRFTDPDDYLGLLAERLSLSESIRAATIWVDGFAGFTPQEVKVLRALFRTSRQVNVALCLDPSDKGLPPAEADLFAPTRETYSLLREAALADGVTVEPEVELRRGASSLPRFSHGVLDHIESQFPRLAPAPYTPPTTPAADGPDGTSAPAGVPVTLVAAANRRAEAEWVAREVVRLCRECGYRYRDVSVVLRSLQGYDNLIAGAFEECGVPFFIDRRRPVPHHPVIELVRSAVEALAGGWQAEPVLRLLKTDLFSTTRDEVDRLENYVLAHGIRGERWFSGGAWDFTSPPESTDDWTSRRQASPEEQAEEEAINRTREAVSGPFRRLAHSLGGRWTSGKHVAVRDITAGLRGLLDDLEVSDQLESWAHAETTGGRPLAAQEHLQVWSGITGLLDQLDESLGEQAVTPEEYLQILESGLAGLHLGIIPPGLDQVMVGSIERSRQPEIKACFVMGATDGVFPASKGDDLVFSDRERDQLAKAGLDLAPGGRRETLREQYFVYIALTRASRRLYVTYPLADEEGRGLAPSPALVGRLRRVVPGVPQVVAGLEPAADGGAEQMEYLARQEQAVRHLARRLRLARGGELPAPVWWGVYRWMQADPGRREVARAALRSLVHSNDVPRLPKDLVRRLHGLQLRSSVSRLEDFAACPFRYFAAHALKLEERPEQQFKAPDMGSFFHAALQVFVKEIIDRRLDWAALGADEAGKLIGEAVDKVAPSIQSQVLMSTARRRHLTAMLRRTLTRSVKMLGEHAKRGKFRPVAVELSFGMPVKDSLPALEIKVGESSLLLRGIIDRLDVAEAPQDPGAAAPGAGWYLRVVDYKSSRKVMDPQRIREGLALQLLVYALVALEWAERNQGASEPANLAAVQYFAVADPMLTATGPISAGDAETQRTKTLRMTGLVLDDPIALALLDGALGDGGARFSDLFTKTARSGEEFAALLSFVRGKVAELAQRILEGEAAVRPWRKGRNSACTYCAYRPVCSFDLLIPGCSYRDLPPIGGKAALDAIVNGGEPPHGQ